MTIRPKQRWKPFDLKPALAAATIAATFVSAAAVTACTSPGTGNGTGEPAAVAEAPRPAQLPNQAPDDAAQQAQAAAPAASGLRVYIDPETGEFLDEPPAAAAPEDEVRDRNAVGPADEPEVFENPIEGGGVMVDPGRRFESYLKARVTDDGVEVGHDLAPPGGNGAETQ